MKLTTLKSKLQRAPARLGALAASAPVVERKRGYAGVKDRERIRKRDGELCLNCGQLGRDVDHDIPLWLGATAGGTDHDNNKRVLCEPCHKAKSAVEAAQRSGGGYDRDAVLRVMRDLERERRLVPRAE